MIDCGYIAAHTHTRTRTHARARAHTHTHTHTWSHVDVIFHRLQMKIHFKKNLTCQKWNLKVGVEVYVIYNFYCFYMSKIQNITAFYRKVQ